MDAYHLAAAFTGALSVSAAAAGQPQALGLVAAADPVPMRCEAGTGRAVLSSFCLQQDHRSPLAADAYRMARPDNFRLVGHDSAGQRPLCSSVQRRNTPRLRCCSLKPRLAWSLFRNWRFICRRTLHLSLLARSKIQHYRKPSMRTG